MTISIEEKLVVLNELIKKSEKIILINHRKMDWDAYWAVLAMKLFLDKLWKTVKCVNDSKTPESLQFAYDKEIFEPELNLKKFNPDLIISLDAASIPQLWDIYENNKSLFEEKDFVVIDHHPFNEWFWKIDIINKAACSTCEIICDYIRDNWYLDLIDRDIATALMLWLITDTNSFMNKNTNSKSLSDASLMVSKWAKHLYLIENLFRKTSFKKTELWANTLFNIKNINWKVIWWKVTNEMFKNTWTTIDDTNWFVDSNLTPIDWSKINFLLYELPDWKIKWSFRSKDDKYDMNEFCGYFWWGWHVRASGFTLDWTLEEIEDKVIDLMKEKYDLV